MIKPYTKSESVDRFPPNLVCDIGDARPSYFLNNDPGLTLTYLNGKVKFGNLGFSI